MTLPIEYSELLTLVLAIFAFVGLMRGWYREGVTSLFIGVLAVLVWKPEIAAGIISKLNAILGLVIKFVKSGFSFDLGTVSAQAVDAKWTIDASSYQFYIVVTTILVIVSYLIGEATFHGKVTPLGRLLGGVLGICNGYVLLSLVRTALINYAEDQGFYAQGAGDVSVRFTDVPAENFFAGYGIIFVFVVLIGVIALLIAGDRLKLPLK
jgi:hypothetical protein